MSSTFGDLGSAVVIIFIFSLLHLILAVSVGIQEVKNNWQHYKCNPGIMPFASVFGHDTAKNFTECVRTSQVDFMGGFLEPIYASIGFLAENGSLFTKMFEKSKIFGNDADNLTGGVVSDMQGRMQGITSGAGSVLQNVNNTFAQLTSTITVLMNSISSGVYGARVSWNEFPGTLMQMAGA